MQNKPEEIIQKLAEKKYAMPVPNLANAMERGFTVVMQEAYKAALRDVLPLIDGWVSVGEPPGLYSRVLIRWNRYFDIFSSEWSEEKSTPKFGHYVPTSDGETCEWLSDDKETIYLPAPDEWCAIPDYSNLQKLLE